MNDASRFQSILLSPTVIWWTTCLSWCSKLLTCRYNQIKKSIMYLQPQQQWPCYALSRRQRTLSTVTMSQRLFWLKCFVLSNGMKMTFCSNKKGPSFVNITWLKSLGSFSVGTDGSIKHSPNISAPVPLLNKLHNSSRNYQGQCWWIKTDI